MVRLLVWHWSQGDINAVSSVTVTCTPHIVQRRLEQTAACPVGACQRGRRGRGRASDAYNLVTFLPRSYAIDRMKWQEFVADRCDDQPDRRPAARDPQRSGIVQEQPA